MRATFISSTHKSKTTSNTPSKLVARTRLSFSSQLQKFIRSLDWLFQKRKSTVFITLKRLLSSELSYSDTKKIQQLILSLQKKTFTSKLWVFYKLKNFKDVNSGNSTLFSHISSPVVRTISSERDNFKPTRLIENKVSALYNFAFVLNKPIQITVLKSFWMIFLYRKPVKVVSKGYRNEYLRAREVDDELFGCTKNEFVRNESNDYFLRSEIKGYYGKNDRNQLNDKKVNTDYYEEIERTDSYLKNRRNIFNPTNEKNGSCFKGDKNQNLSFDWEKKRNGVYCKGNGNNGVWGTRIKLNEKFLVKSGNDILRILRYVEKSHKTWAFEGLKNGNMRGSSGFFQYLVSKDSINGMKVLAKILDKNRKICLGHATKCMRSLKKRIISSKNIRKLENTLSKIIKKKTLKSIYTYGFIKRVLQKVNLLTYYLIKVTKKSQAFGFFKIKSYIKYKNFALTKFTEALQRVFLLNKANTFLILRRFSNELMPNKSNTRVIQRVDSKLTTLPTIFLQGDPSYKEFEEFSFSTTNKRQTLFKF